MKNWEVLMESGETYWVTAANQQQAEHMALRAALINHGRNEVVQLAIAN